MTAEDVLLSFEPGDLIGDCRDIDIVILDDLRLELTESVSVVLSSTETDAAVVTIIQSDAVVLILDDDRKLYNMVL